MCVARGQACNFTAFYRDYHNIACPRRGVALTCVVVFRARILEQDSRLFTSLIQLF